MNELQENVPISDPKRKKIIIAAGIVIFLIIIIIILVMTQPGTNQPPDKKITTPVSITPDISRSPSGKQLIQIPISSIPNWITYTGSDYSFDYPFDWLAQRNDIEGGGEMVTVKPAALPNGIYYPVFILEKEPFREKRIEQRIDIEKVLGLVESEITILNQKAKKLSGTLPFKKYGNEAVKEPVQQTIILMTYGNNNYAFEYQYEGNQINKDLEGYFNDFISTVKFQ